MTPEERERDRGAVLAIVAICLGFLITITAITVDLGRLSLRRRDMQAIADMVALDMARLANGRTTSEIMSSADPSWAAELDRSAQRNAFDSSRLGYRLGDMDGNTFVPNADPAHRPTAVEITATDDINYFFAPGGGSVTRTAVGTLGSSACFTVGSFAAAVSANPTSLLPSLLNSALDASVVSYGGLANARVTLTDVAANLGFGSPRDLLDATVNQQGFYLATANALSQAGDTADASVLQTIAAQTTSSAAFQFGNLVNVQQGGEEAAFTTAFNVLDLVAGSAFLVNGNRSLSIPDLGVTVPGLVGASASVVVTERPQQACTAVDEQGATTNQIRVVVDLAVGLPFLPVTDLSFALTMASASGTLVAPLSCGPPALVNVAVSGSLVTSSISQSVLGITASIAPSPQGVGGSTVGFTLPPDTYGQTKRTGSGSVGLGSTDISVFAPDVQVTLTAALPIIDSLLVDPLLSQFAGLTIAGADVAANSTSCNDVLLAK